MELNKKGIFFTITVLVILSLFLVTYTIYSLVNDQKTIQKRVSTMNNFLFSIEQDLQRQLYISGFRSILVAEEWIVSNGQYISDINSTFQENFFNGTMYGQGNSLLDFTKYADIIDSTNQKASSLNINFTFANPHATITQDNPWHIKFILVFDMQMKDQSNLASWNRTETITAQVPISNFEDPIYLVATSGKTANSFNKTLTYTFVQGSDVSALLDHATNSRYIESSSAPSFINRLQGQIASSSPYGVESLVNLQELAGQGISLQDKSCIDYIYFSSLNPTSYHVTGMPSWFKIDDTHISTYQVADLTY